MWAAVLSFGAEPPERLGGPFGHLFWLALRDSAKKAALASILRLFLQGFLISLYEIKLSEYFRGQKSFVPRAENVVPKGGKIRSKSRDRDDVKDRCLC